MRIHSPLARPMDNSGVTKAVFADSVHRAVVKGNRLVEENNSETRDSIAPVLPVADVRASSEYLVDKLGFTIEEPFGNDRGWSVVRKGRSTIVLVPKDWPVGCEIRVDDVDQVFAELLALGAKFESPLMNQEYGQRDFTVRGPDGSVISFWSPTKLSAQAVRSKNSNQR